MNWFAENSMSLLGFMITISAAGSTLIASDKSKKIVGVVIAVLGASFTLINTISTKQQSKLESNRADSLQNVINNKADTITTSLRRQDSTFIKQFQWQLDTLRNFNISLSILKTASKHLNDTLSNEILLQKQTNVAANALFKKQVESDSINTINYKMSLVKTFHKICTICDYVWYGRGRSGYRDSIDEVQDLINVVSQTIQLLDTEFDNPILINDSLLYKPWKDFQYNLDQFHYYLSGYGYQPIHLTVSQFVGAYTDFNYHYSGLLSNYLWESESQKENIRIHFNKYYQH